MSPSVFLQKLQKLGKALMLPIASLPVAALMLRLGQDDLLNLPFLAAAGGALFDNLPLFFAIGVAVGLTSGNNGTAGLAGAIGFYVMNGTAGALVTWLVTPVAAQAPGLFGGFGGFAWAQEMYAGVKAINMAHFGGIIAGVIAGVCYNRYKDVTLPAWLGFFGGQRFVPMATCFYAILVGSALGLLWPLIQAQLDALAISLAGIGALGSFIYGVLNRVLVTVGLHHVANTYFWFNYGEFINPDGAIVRGDLLRFFAGDPSAGHYMAGFFPITMFALPAVALAMYTCAKKENKKIVGGAMLSLAIPAFLCGITEPIEFTFMFLAPFLYILHGLLTGLSLAVCNLLDIKMGFGFSPGLFDMLLNWRISTNPSRSIAVGLAMFVIYYTLFVYFIRKLNLPTPGREHEPEIKPEKKEQGDVTLDGLAQQYIELLGGAANIREVIPCVTRLRLVLRASASYGARK